MTTNRVLAIGIICSLLTSTNAAADSRQISRADYGGAWPLTVESGQLECLPGSAVVFRSGGVAYAVNGTAKGHKLGVDIRPIWRDRPGGSGLKVNIGPLIDDGLALCE